MSIIYKQILLEDEVLELNTYLMDRTHKQISNLATGSRLYCDINLNSHTITDRLFIVLRDYFPDMKLDKNARFYNHQYGAIKPHYDVNHDGVSTHTLLIYLTDDFEGGRLIIKTKRPDEERLIIKTKHPDEERLLSSQPNHYHKVFTITPKIGYGVIFKKNNLHWADDCIGDKNFLLIHMYSSDNL